MNTNPLSKEQIEQAAKHYADLQGISYPVSDVYRNMIASQIKNAFISGAEYLTQSSPQVSNGWNLVSDGTLPELRKPVLVYMSYGKIDVCYWDGESFRQALRAQHTNGSVTHWKSLSLPPTESQTPQVSEAARPKEEGLRKQCARLEKSNSECMELIEEQQKQNADLFKIVAAQKEEIERLKGAAYRFADIAKEERSEKIKAQEQGQARGIGTDGL